MEENFIFAISLTLFAGLSTGVGSLLALFAKRTNKNFLTISLGFSAGVMIYVSFVEILFKARESLEGVVGLKNAHLLAIVAFFGGMLLIALIDKLVPDYENPHEINEVEAIEEMNRITERLKTMETKNPSDHTGHTHKEENKLYRMGFFSALAVGIHNFPEGLATFASALKDPALGIGIAVAIAIHNIPEGIAVSVPIYYATGSRKKAFIYSFLSGLAEPIGALVGYFFLYRYFNDFTFGLLFAGVAGIMVFISLDQLLPTAEKYGHHHHAIYGLVSGMIVMALSLYLFI